MKIILALIVSPLVASVFYVLITSGSHYGLDKIIGYFKLTLIAAYVQTIVMGIPIYMLFKSREVLGFVNIISASALVAAAPWILWIVFSLFYLDNYFARGVVIVENGHITPDGIWDTAKIIAQIGLSGALAGGIFWLIVNEKL